MAYITHDLKEFESDTFTVTLTRTEIEMLMHAVQMQTIRYRYPKDGSEPNKASAKRYSDLGIKLNALRVEQDEARWEEK